MITWQTLFWFQIHKNSKTKECKPLRMGMIADDSSCVLGRVEVSLGQTKSRLDTVRDRIGHQQRKGLALIYRLLTMEQR